MYLTGFVHRDRLFDLSVRWLQDAPLPSDGRTITEVFVYEGLASVATAREFMNGLYEHVFGGPLHHVRTRYKHEVRERALQAIGDPSPRQYEMMEAYHRNPEAFFPRMPTDASLIFTDDERLVGANRIKRPRRVAEKVSRRMADYLGRRIREKAHELALDRAHVLGVALDDLGRDQEAESREFTLAESALAQRFRHQTIEIPREALHVDDVIGFKVIGHEDELAAAEQYIAQSPDVQFVEREEHRGHYNAVNILIDLQLPPEEHFVALSRRIDWSFASKRGLDPMILPDGLVQYVRDGSPRFRVELILTTFEEFLESELGRCIHEYRVLEQRYNRQYTGRIAKNGEFIIEYALAVAFCPSVRVGEIPVKMWGHYLPETLSHAVRRLHGHGHVSLILPIFTDP